jgi:hypothetical protein
MKYKLILLLLFIVDAIVLFLESSEVSVSSAEAYLLYNENSPLAYLLNSFLERFGSSDYLLRFPFIIMHLLSALMLYSISEKYLKSEKNRLWLFVMFLLLPGTVSSAIVVSHAGFIIFGLLLYIYIDQKVSSKLAIAILPLYLADGGFSYLFLALALYSFNSLSRELALYTFALYLVSVYLHGFDIYGYPRGHFLDTLGIYSAIFTPVVFIYIFYVLYRRYLTKRQDKLWYIATVAFVYSLLVSFRQKIDVEHFAPYLIVALPLAAETFASSYRVRLKEHRRGYRSIFIVAFIFLLLNTFIVFFNKELYLVLDNPKKNFAYNMHVAKELAKKLHSMGIDAIKTNEKMQRRLRFYGIADSDNYKLKELPYNTKKHSDVTISYKGKILYRADVTKLNNN